MMESYLQFLCLLSLCIVDSCAVTLPTKFYGAAAASLVLAWVVQLHAGGMVRFVRGVIANPLSLNGEATSDPIFHPISFPPSPSHKSKNHVGTMNIMDNNSHKYKQLRSESIKNSYHR